jgi:hypothetical protein
MMKITDEDRSRISNLPLWAQDLIRRLELDRNSYAEAYSAYQHMHPDAAITAVVRNAAGPDRKVPIPGDTVTVRDRAGHEYEVLRQARGLKIFCTAGRPLAALASGGRNTLNVRSLKGEG